MSAAGRIGRTYLLRWALLGSVRFLLVFSDRSRYHAEGLSMTGRAAVDLPEWETMPEQERWLSVEEIAAHRGVNRDTIYKWIERKQMPAHKLGKLWKFKATEIDEWVRADKAGSEGQEDGRRDQV
jgi:excisionase family DNA binding protein